MLTLLVVLAALPAFVYAASDGENAEAESIKNLSTTRNLAPATSTGDAAGTALTETNQAYWMGQKGTSDKQQRATRAMVWMGSYWQETYDQKTPLLWRVLRSDENNIMNMYDTLSDSSANPGILMMSEYTLNTVYYDRGAYMNGEYDSSLDSNVWFNMDTMLEGYPLGYSSDIRAWMNGVGTNAMYPDIPNRYNPDSSADAADNYHLQSSGASERYQDAISNHRFASFYESTFTREEQERIGYTALAGSNGKTTIGGNTRDKVFVFSYDWNTKNGEATDQYLFADPASRVATVTKVLYNNGKRENPYTVTGYTPWLEGTGGFGSDYWTRSPYPMDNFHEIVIGTSGRFHETYSGGVLELRAARPTIQLIPNSVIFTAASETGSQPAVNSTLVKMGGTNATLYSPSFTGGATARIFQRDESAHTNAKLTVTRDLSLGNYDSVIIRSNGYGTADSDDYIGAMLVCTETDNTDPDNQIYQGTKWIGRIGTVSDAESKGLQLTLGPTIANAKQAAKYRLFIWYEDETAEKAYQLTTLPLADTAPEKISVTYHSDAEDEQQPITDTYPYTTTAITLKGRSLFQKENYTFIGWSLSSTAESPDHEPGDIIPYPSQDLNLYAVWKSNPFTVTFTAGEGGTGNAVTRTVAYGETIAFPDMGHFSKNGCVLSGWSVSPANGEDSTYDNTVNSATLKVLSNLTISAVWAESGNQMYFKTLPTTMDVDPTLEELFQNGMEVALLNETVYSGEQNTKAYTVTIYDKTSTDLSKIFQMKEEGSAKPLAITHIPTGQTLSLPRYGEAVEKKVVGVTAAYTPSRLIPRNSPEKRGDKFLNTIKDELSLTVHYSDGSESALTDKSGVFVAWPENTTAGWQTFQGTCTVDGTDYTFSFMARQAPAVSNPDAEYGSYEYILTNVQDWNAMLVEGGSCYLAAVTPSAGYRLEFDDGSADFAALAGSVSFQGRMNGNGQTITGLTRPLFSELSSASVSRLNLAQVAIQSSGESKTVQIPGTGSSTVMTAAANVGSSDETSGKRYAGALADIASGTTVISDCQASGTIDGTSVGGEGSYSRTGGLVGIIKHETVKVTGSASSCSVSGKDAGGITAMNSGSVEECYSAGKVEAKGSGEDLSAGGTVGGIAAAGGGNVKNSYSSSTLNTASTAAGAKSGTAPAQGNIIDSVYDCQMAGSGTAEGTGTGVDTKTFLEAGNDGKSLPEIGLEGTWEKKNGTYPMKTVLTAGQAEMSEISAVGVDLGTDSLSQLTLADTIEKNHKVTLPTTTAGGKSITWQVSSSNPTEANGGAEVIRIDGNTLQAEREGSTVLSAACGGITRDFQLRVVAENLPVIVQNGLSLPIYGTDLDGSTPGKAWVNDGRKIWAEINGRTDGITVYLLKKGEEDTEANRKAFSYSESLGKWITDEVVSEEGVYEIHGKTADGRAVEPMEIQVVQIDTLTPEVRNLTLTPDEAAGTTEVAFSVIDKRKTGVDGTDTGSGIASVQYAQTDDPNAAGENANAPGWTDVPAGEKQEDGSVRYSFTVEGAILKNLPKYYIKAVDQAGNSKCYLANDVADIMDVSLPTKMMFAVIAGENGVHGYAPVYQVENHNSQMQVQVQIGKIEDVTEEMHTSMGLPYEPEKTFDLIDGKTNTSYPDNPNALKAYLAEGTGGFDGVDGGSGYALYPKTYEPPLGLGVLSGAQESGGKNIGGFRLNLKPYESYPYPMESLRGVFRTGWKLEKVEP